MRTLLICAVLAAMAISLVGQDLQIGIAVGQKIPSFRLPSQDGRVLTFDAIKGPKGTALLFFRSADWCPYCKTQLVQLQASLDQYRQQGLGVAAISYDSVEILKNFSDRMHISYPMLSDKDSVTIKAFGIFNTQVPPSSAQYGIPYPGMYIVDPSGKIVARYFEEKYQERFTPDTILTKQFGIGTATVSEVQTEHLKLTLSQSQITARPGNRVSFIADITLPPKMHIYAPGVKGYLATALNFDSNPAVQIHPTLFPKAEVLMLPAIKEKVPVFERRLRITRDVTVSDSTRLSNITLTGTFEYQACDDTICYLAKKVPLKFDIVVEALDRQRVPEEMRRKP